MCGGVYVGGGAVGGCWALWSAWGLHFTPSIFVSVKKSLVEARHACRHTPIGVPLELAAQEVAPALAVEQLRADTRRACPATQEEEGLIVGQMWWVGDQITIITIIIISYHCTL